MTVVVIMIQSYKLNQLELGKASSGGHVVYTSAIYNDGDKRKRVIYKLNKNNISHNSVMEVAFGGLASRFLQPKLTSNQYLVENELGVITGLVSEHLTYPVKEREPADAEFYSIVKKNQNIILTRNNPSEAKVYFLNQFSPGFFALLSTAFKEKKLTMDWDSLASVLTTSYTLEEDDLHKGNFGFYVVRKDDKPHVVFVKIDHDLMMSDSLMSHGNARWANWLFGRNAFSITQRDLQEFPKLSDSKNFYWPTSKRYLANPIDPKVYSSADEIRAFVGIGTFTEFKRAKWRAFYKHLLIPPNVIADSLCEAFDKENPYDRAQIALITNAVVTRQARLRAVLFSMDEFRQFVANFEEEDQLALKENELLDGIPEGIARNSLSAQLSADMQKYQRLCASEDFFKSGDTPMHTAIRLGDFRYQETWNCFEEFVDQKNDAGEAPLDVVIKKAQNYTFEDTDDVRADPVLTIQYMLRKGVSRTPLYKGLDSLFKNEVKSYIPNNPHLLLAENAASYMDLLEVFRNIGEDERYTLKMKKELSISCMGKFIAGQQDQSIRKHAIQRFKLALNGNKETAPVPELQYIRQLRTDLWIIRQIRGLLGGTSTQVSLNEMIDKELEKLTPKTGNSCFRWFFQKQTPDEKNNSDQADLRIIS